MTTVSLPVRTVVRRGVAAPQAAVQGAPQNIVALPQTVNLTIYQGDDLTLNVAVLNPDGSPADLSSSAPRSQIRETAVSEEILHTLVITVDPDITGLLHVDFPAMYTADLPLNSVWDLQLSIPVINTICAGKIITIREVTRP